MIVYMPFRLTCNCRVMKISNINKGNDKRVKRFNYKK